MLLDNFFKYKITIKIKLKYITHWRWRDILWHGMITIVTRCRRKVWWCNRLFWPRKRVRPLEKLRRIRRLIENKADYTHRQQYDRNFNSHTVVEGVVIARIVVVVLAVATGLEEVLPVFLVGTTSTSTSTWWIHFFFFFD